jgi:hypothetical protein
MAILVIVVLLQIHQQTQLPDDYKLAQQAIVPEQIAHFTTGKSSPSLNKAAAPTGAHTVSSPVTPVQQQQQQQLPAVPVIASSVSASHWDPQSFPLGIPPGHALNLPALPVRSNNAAAQTPVVEQERRTQNYGGQGDAKHLGGFSNTALGLAGVSPAVWKHMVTDYGVKSVLDVGCGRGVSTSWFALHGVDALCVEGSHDAAARTLLTDPYSQLVEHDFTRGPWWPAKTYDAAWAVEFVEQVSLQYHVNYVSAFRKAALIFVSTDQFGSGWHHVEVHPEEWWIRKYELYGLKYDRDLTYQVRRWARDESKNDTAVAPNGEHYNAQHVWSTMKVFVNPVVAALPQHAHLFPEFGCYGGRGDGKIFHRECGTGRTGALETPLDPSLYPIPLTEEMDDEWENLIRRDLGLSGVLVKPKRAAPAVTAIPTTTTSASPVVTPPAVMKKPPTSPLGQKLDRNTVDRNQMKDTTNTEYTMAQAALEISETVLSAWREGYEDPNYTGPVTLTNMTGIDLKELPIVPVVVWPYVEFGKGTAEALHIEENGVQESKFLTLAADLNNFDPNVVWVGDTGYAYGWNPWCNEYLKRVQMARTKRKALGLPLSWPIYIVDFTDGVTRQRCKAIERLLGKEYVRYSQRSLARKRHWDFDKKWVDVGFHIPMDHEGTTYRHSPLIVRTDTIEALKEVLTLRNMNMSSPLEELERPVDVIHLWPVDWTGVGNVSSILRTQVSRVVTDLAKTEKLNAFVGLKGSAVRTGRRGVKHEYIEALLDTKIVVVTQRDDWEDHYRLFEAVISGALVLTDRMLGMPQGLVNGTSIVEFATEEDLKQKILYYLAHMDERREIARRGREVAMTRHRTWHRIEDVIFGRPMSECSPDKPDSHCPYIVHANEARR